jgi:apolipoprotein N-acyltransferase
MASRYCSSTVIRAVLPWLAAIAGGVLQFLGFVGFDLFYLEWIFLVPVLWAIREQSPGRAFFIGWVAGIVFATWAWGTRLITRGTSWNVAWVSPVVWTAVEKFCPEIFPVYGDGGLDFLGLRDYLHSGHEPGDPEGAHWPK